MKFEPKDFEVFKPMIIETIKDCFNDQINQDFEKKLYSITQAQKILGMSYNWVSGKIKDGTLKTTSDGKYITGKELNRYLGQ
jgi:hypothetical protein